MMRRTTRLLKISLAVLFALGAARGAHAQNGNTQISESQGAPKVEIAFGYTYMRSDIVVTGSSFNMNGGSGSVAFNLKSWLGIVGDVGFDAQGNVAASGLDVNITTYQAGPRISFRRRHLVPFAQVLAGFGHAGGTLYTTSLGVGLAPIGTSNAFVLTAGGGVDWKLHHGIGIRIIQAEYLYSQFANGPGNNNRQNNLRLSAGLVLSFGHR
jgi:hypothetical protein